MNEVPWLADPSASFRKLPRPIRERIRRVSPRATACWLWLGPLHYNGRPCFHPSIAECVCYGRQSWPIVVDDDKTSRTNWLAHRLVRTIIEGEVDPELVLDHLKYRCTSRRCVRPDHNEPVTHAVNRQRGGGWWGSKKLVVPERKRVFSAVLEDDEVPF